MIFYPRADFNNVKEIKLEFLKENQIKALILDVDNTLIDYDRNLDKEIISWANNLKENGIKLHILSNSNKRDKVKEVAERLGVEYNHFAKKPLKSGFKKVQKILQERAEQIGVVGDQIFTDIIGGNRCKMFTILVEPIAEKDIWITMLKRPIEKAIKDKYKKTIKQ
ncbi:MAG: YqeG family HAD IIIA-type phosphatase [Clostridia bacterium]|jgi:HAD superfamily phosphatase (TIGR01668 family)|nr:YqeG family HAD IIIA-type phosphatase [Clostridia bacterium]